VDEAVADVGRLPPSSFDAAQCGDSIAGSVIGAWGKSAAVRASEVERLEVELTGKNKIGDGSHNRLWKESEVRKLEHLIRKFFRIAGPREQSPKFQERSYLCSGWGI
jgi:hypothetical protein